MKKALQGDQKAAVLGCTALGTLKEAEVDAKDISSKLANKSEVSHDADDAETADNCDYLQQFATLTRDLIKAWKQYAHAFSENAIV